MRKASYCCEHVCSSTSEPVNTFECVRVVALPFKPFFLSPVLPVLSFRCVYRYIDIGIYY